MKSSTSTATSEYDHFLAELRSLRSGAGVSQLDLAEALGQPQSYVSKCERGARRLDVIELRAWVAALGVEPVAFMVSLEDRIARNARLTISGAQEKVRRHKA
jgi:transcriptional regulator with XRE-family HTH domain